MARAHAERRAISVNRRVNLWIPPSCSNDTFQRRLIGRPPSDERLLCGNCAQWSASHKKCARGPLCHFRTMGQLESRVAADDPLVARAAAVTSPARCMILRKRGPRIDREMRRRVFDKRPASGRLHFSRMAQPERRLQNRLRDRSLGERRSTSLPPNGPHFRAFNFARRPAMTERCRRPTLPITSASNRHSLRRFPSTSTRTWKRTAVCMHDSSDYVNKRAENGAAIARAHCSALAPRDAS